MEVTVFVLFDAEAFARVDATVVADLLARKHPRWRIERRPTSGISLGRYDQAPVRLSRRADASVAAESADMAAVVSRHTADTELARRIRGSSGRFELYWNTRQDADPGPETAELVLDAAQDLAAKVAGIVLVDGSRLLPARRGTEADDLALLFP